MNNKNKIILIALIVFTILVVGVCAYTILNNKETNTDALKFRDEYSELNGKTENGNTYVEVNISDTNTVDYVSEEEAVELLKDGTGVIYFGFSKCPWCRSLVSSLTSIAEEKEETIYYLDILDIRSSFELEDGKLNKTKEGTKSYYELLELLDEELTDYSLTDEDGKKYDTEEKRLYAPTMVAFKDGEITDFHVGTVESQENGFDELDKTQRKELEDIISKLIDSKNGNLMCTDDKC